MFGLGKKTQPTTSELLEEVKEVSKLMNAANQTQAAEQSIADAEHLLERVSSEGNEVATNFLTDLLRKMRGGS